MAKRVLKTELQAQLNQAQKQQDYLFRLYENALVQNARTLSRAGLASALGQSFGGDRDLYETLGYKREPDFGDYLNFYERDGIATRLVDAIADETWRNHPVLTEKKSETPDEDNPSKLHTQFEDMADRLDLWAKFNEVDRACGISRFGLLYLGLSMASGETPEKPVSGKKEILYVTVHDEGDASVDEMSLVTDPNNPRFGMPEYYQINVGAMGSQVRVHYSRVVHVKEGRERSEYGRFYGVPRLKKVINRLYDLEKVVGGGSEAFWMLIHRGLALSSKDGMTIPPKGTTERQDLIDETEEYANKIKRIMLLSGMDVTDLGGKPVDSREQFDVIIAYLAGAERTPQRLLVGSEEGKLASTQDDANFGDFISWRRENHAEPYILRPFLRRAAELGQFEKRDRYFAFWSSPFQLNDMEQADVAVKIATAVNQATGGAPEIGIPPEEFVKHLPGKWKYIWTPEKLAEIAEENEPEPVPPVNPFGANGDNADELPEPSPNGSGQFSANKKLDLNRIKVALLGANNQRSFTADAVQVGSQITIIHNENEHSAMVALRIPDNLRQELQQAYPIMSDETRDNLHVTLAFLGDERTLDRSKLVGAMADFVMSVKPIKTQLQGIARFVSGGEKDPIVATIDSPDLPAFRQALTDALDKHGIPYHKEHGFIPHMTIAYIPKDDPMPMDTIEPLEMNFDSACLVVGNQWIAFQLRTADMTRKNPFNEFGERVE